MATRSMFDFELELASLAHDMDGWSTLFALAKARQDGSYPFLLARYQTLFVPKAIERLQALAAMWVDTTGKTDTDQLAALEARADTGGGEDDDKGRVS